MRALLHQRGPAAAMAVMQIIELLDTPVALAGATVLVASQRRLVDRWDGEDPPGLQRIWSIKPKFAVGGARSCAELIIVDQLA
jgi:hypothetical protein